MWMVDIFMFFFIFFPFFSFLLFFSFIIKNLINRISTSDRSTGRIVTVKSLRK